MVQAVLPVPGPLESPLDAAADFFAGHLPAARELLARGASKRSPASADAGPVDALVVVFPAAGPEHHGWRLAAVQALAREAAPKRVNGVAGSDEAAIAETVEWLGSAKGITGQLLAVDGKSAETR